MLWKNKELPIKNIDFDNSLASYFSEYIRRDLELLDEELDINIYEDGLNIHTTLDMSIQRIVEDTFNEVMEKNQKIFNASLLNSNNKDLGFWSYQLLILWKFVSDWSL